MWLRRSDGLLLEVDEGTPEHEQLVALGAELVDDPVAKKPAGRRKAAAASDVDGETLGE